jgi:hypothetical protein
MNKLKEIAEKSEGRVIIATLPKIETPENGENPESPKSKGKGTEPKHQDKPQKTLADMQAEFDRLNRLFYRQRCFEGAKKRIKEYSESLATESQTELESKNFRLILGSGYNNEDLKITNREVITDTLNYLTARIETAIEGIMDEILKG